MQKRTTAGDKTAADAIIEEVCYVEKKIGFRGLQMTVLFFFLKKKEKSEYLY